jgi:3-hydroxyacyl-[acyl-carrier-protein] dehydratase
MVDEIVEVEPGVRLRARKMLRAEEQYLRDHFPQFPVMPGVLMLEAMFQTAMWLVRKSEDFASAVVVLKEARAIKYADFVQPGQTLDVTAQIVSQTDDTVVLKTQGTVEGRMAVSGRLVLERFNLADRDPERKTLDPVLRRKFRQQYAQLCGS